MLFQTGFAVDKAQPATDPALLQGRKRKRASQDGKEEQVKEAEVNLEKLMEKLRQAERGSGANATSSKPKESGPGSAWKKQIAAKNADAGTTSSPAKAVPAISSKKQGKQPEECEQKSASNGHDAATKASKKASKAKSSEPYIPDEAALAKREARKFKRQRRDEASATQEADPKSEPEPVEELMEVESAETPAASSTAMTDLQKSMQKKLGGARFRWINEQLVRCRQQARVNSLD